MTPSWLSEHAATPARASARAQTRVERAACDARFIPSLRLSPVLSGCLEGRLRRRQPRDRQPVGGAGDVVEANLVAELDRRRVAAVLAADADLQLGLLLAAGR